MLLTIDIGNSQIAFGVFDKGNLQASWRLATSTTKTSDEYGALFLSLMREGGIQPQNLDTTFSHQREKIPWVIYASHNRHRQLANRVRRL